MRLEPYDNKDGRKVWLDREEVELLLDHAADTEQAIALGLLARCGLRRDEAASVTPPDVVGTDLGPRVRVEHGKGDKYREVPIPGDLKTTVDVFAEQRDASSDTPLVDRSARTVQRWVTRAAERCAAETGDGGWQYLGPHDLRRTWGTLLVEAGVEPGMIMSWGGWEDWTTFRTHYLGAYSPEMERRQAALVPWLEQRAPQRGSGRSNPRGRGRESRSQNSFSERHR
jgi:integrase